MTSYQTPDIISVNNTFLLFTETMKFQEFKKKISKFPVFSSSHLSAFEENTQLLKNQLSSWCKKKLIIKLKRGLYILNPEDRKLNPSSLFIAMQLTSPCYISTQYALSYYGLIPERVTDITCITTKKTNSYENELGTFVYQHLKLAVFNGFKELKDENNLPYFMAEPEKALIDFFYLNLKSFKGKNSSVFKLSFRLRKNVKLNTKKLLFYAKIFNNKTLLKIVNSCIKYLKS